MREVQSQVKAINAVMGFKPRPRNGKIARLPEPTRNRINQMLDDGMAYHDILTQLQLSASPLLPYLISQMNLSNWVHGGYQDWTFQRSLDELPASSLLRRTPPNCSKLQQIAVFKGLIFLLARAVQHPLSGKCSLT